MIRRLLALATAALLLLVGTACFEVDNRLVIHADGHFTHTLRLGQPTALVPTQHPATSAGRWESDVAAAIGTWATAHVEVSDDVRWYVLEASLPDLDAYRAYRTAFLEGLKAQNKPYTWTAPPTVTPEAGHWLVQLDDDGAGTSNTVRTDPHAPNRFTLTIEVPELGDHNADEQQGTTVRWQRPTGEVLQRGLRAWVHVPQPSPWHWWHFGAMAGVLLLVVGAGVAFGSARGRA